jgi:hypothetical protein
MTEGLGSVDLLFLNSFFSKLANLYQGVQAGRGHDVSSTNTLIGKTID